MHFCGQKSDLHSDISAVNQGEFDSRVKVICLFLNYFKLSILSKPVFHRENTSSIYLFQNSGSITLDAKRLFMRGFRFGKVFIVNHAKSLFSRVFLPASP